MVDDNIREALEISLRAALRDQARANFTVEFLREKLGLAGAASPIVLGPGIDSDEDRVAEARDVGPIQVTDGEFFGMSQPKAAAIFLDRAGRTRPQRTEAIIAALKKGGVEFKGKDPAQTFYTILARSPSFTNVGKSTWGLSSWYPDRSKKPSKGVASAPPKSSDGLGSATGEPEDDGSVEIPAVGGPSDEPAAEVEQG
jgi:hypothetical protein